MSKSEVPEDDTKVSGIIKNQTSTDVPTKIPPIEEIMFEVFLNFPSIERV